MVSEIADICRERLLGVAPHMNLFYQVYGEKAAGIPVICLHGYWRTAKDFEELGGHLAPSRKVVVPDLRGRGRSDRSADPSDYAFQHIAADVLKLLDAEDIERAVFVGLALGAQLTMDIAARVPGRVAGIVFNDSAPETVASSGHRMSAFSGGDALTRDEAMDRVKAQYGETFPKMTESQFERMLYRNYRKTPEGTYVRDFDQLTNEALRKTYAEHPTFWSEYERIPDIPIAVLRGENSDFITPEIVARMLAERSRAGLHVIPDCGHPALLWEPEAFAAIDALLAEVDRAQA